MCVDPTLEMEASPGKCSQSDNSNKGIIILYIYDGSIYIKYNIIE